MVEAKGCLKLNIYIYKKKFPSLFYTNNYIDASTLYDKCVLDIVEDISEFLHNVWSISRSKIAPMEYIVQSQTLPLTAPIPTSKLLPKKWSISAPKLPPKKWTQGNLYKYK